jgi:histidyl-tRNA synthetase
VADTMQAVRGMNDVLPSQSGLWQWLEATVHDWLEAYGYAEIRTPLVEPTGLFVRSIGEATDIVEKEMYTFVDSLNGESLTLRPEGTAACLRAVLQHQLLYAGPQRLWYQGPMFRHERPQRGRYRQFHQIGVEALGYPGPDVDAEHIVMTARLWRALGLADVTLELNTLGSASARARYRDRLVAYFARHREALSEDERRRLAHNPLRILDSKNPALAPVIADAPRLMDDLDEESLLHFERLRATLRDTGVPYTINPRLVRGLDYYNATVFEWVTKSLGAQGTICAGGRYDGLIEQLGGKPAPGCGFAMGVERLLALLEAAQFAAPARAPDVYLIHHGDAAQQRAPVLAERLRDAALKVVMHCGGGSIKSQMKRADSSGARFAVILADDEIASDSVSIKPLRGQGEQTRATIDDAVAMIKQG